MKVMPNRARAVIEDMSRRYGVAVDEIMGDRQTRRVVEPRHAAMRGIRALTRADGTPAFSYPRIGALFNRHHSTAIAAVQGDRRGHQRVAAE